MSKRTLRLGRCGCLLLTAFAVLGIASNAQADGLGPAELKVMADTAWTMITAFLVFWMNAGFALVESGFCRAKNAVNILAKNFIVFAIASLAFWVLGFGLMFGDGTSFVGLHGFMFSGEDNSPATGEAYKGVFHALNWTGVPLYAKFFFQLVFAGTAATIVSGAVAERIKFNAFIIFSFFLVGIVYPVAGHWIWGGGYLSQHNFWDFAGSTVVHSIGGWAALAGAILLGPRLGKYRPDGTIQSIPGHSMTSATLGAFILWLGWFGFNPGSTMAADADAISRIALTTNLAAAAATMTACLTAWLKIGTPDLSMIINGCLAGLVAITAPCAFVSPLGAVLIGAVAGVLVVLAVLAIDKLKVDDPVGAISVHLVNGIWGTLALGLLAQAPWAGGANQPKVGLCFGGGLQQLMDQARGVALVAVFVFPVSLLFWLLLRALGDLRVTPEEEIEGLDLGEMGMEAYPRDPVSALEHYAPWSVSHPKPAER